MGEAAGSLAVQGYVASGTASCASSQSGDAYVNRMGLAGCSPIKKRFVLVFQVAFKYGGPFVPSSPLQEFRLLCPPLHARLRQRPPDEPFAHAGCMAGVLVVVVAAAVGIQVEGLLNGGPLGPSHLEKGRPCVLHGMHA